MRPPISRVETESAKPPSATVAVTAPVCFALRGVAACQEGHIAAAVLSLSSTKPAKEIERLLKTNQTTTQTHTRHPTRTTRANPQQRTGTAILVALRWMCCPWFQMSPAKSPHPSVSKTPTISPAATRPTPHSNPPYPLAPPPADTVQDFAAFTTAAATLHSRFLQSLPGSHIADATDPPTLAAADIKRFSFSVIFECVPIQPITPETTLFTPALQAVTPGESPFQ